MSIIGVVDLKLKNSSRPYYKPTRASISSLEHSHIKDLHHFYFVADNLVSLVFILVFKVHLLTHIELTFPSTMLLYECLLYNVLNSPICWYTWTV